MAELFKNSSFTDLDGNNPLDWTVVEVVDTQVWADSTSQTVGLYSQDPGQAYLEQTVTNVDTTQQATLSFTYYNTSFNGHGIDRLLVEILDDTGAVAQSWTVEGAYSAFSQNFTPPSSEFSVRFSNASVDKTADMPVFVIAPSLDGTLLPDPVVPCFGAGTMIDTEKGPVPIEMLKVGDMVATVDNGYQPIRWIGNQHISKAALAQAHNVAPIRIPAGALGQNLPKVDLVVSPQHRILVKSKIAARMFDAHEILVPAIKLIGVNGIYQDIEADGISYYHMLFDRHEIVWSNGAATESLFTGPQALKAVGRDGYAEILTLFPQLADPEYIPVSARVIPKGKVLRQMAERHVKNNKPLYAA